MSFRSSSRESLGLMLGFVGMTIFGGTLPATRMAVSQIDPIALTSLRTAIAGLCSLALLMVLRRPLPPRALWPQLAIAMLCVSILFPLLMSLGMQTVDASHGGVVLGILPIATALVAVAITHERPRPLFWIASIAGAALVIAFALRQGGGTLSAGDLLLFAAVAVSSIGYAFSGRLTAEMPGWEVISWVLVIALPISARSRTDDAIGPRPHRPEAVAGAALRRAVFAMDRLLRLECRHGDGGIAGCRRCSCCNRSSHSRSPRRSTARPSRGRPCCSPLPSSRRWDLYADPRAAAATAGSGAASSGMTSVRRAPGEINARALPAAS